MIAPLGVENQLSGKELTVSGLYASGINIYALYVANYGTPSGRVNFTLILDSSAFVVSVADVNGAAYAITNPNSWAAGSKITLVIRSGAIVAGRGGDGGRGGRAWTTPGPDANGYYQYYGNGSNGKKGNNGIHALFPLRIDNQGIISVGGGGGGGAGGMCATLANQYSVCVSGAGGGGGWPFGSGGLIGQNRADDSSTSYYEDMGYYYGHIYMYPGYIGTNASQYGEGYSSFGQTITATNRSGGSDNYYAGGGGAGGYATDGADAETPIYNNPYGSTYLGNAGFGNTKGANAVKGNNLVTWINSGTIYGSLNN